MNVNGEIKENQECGWCGEEAQLRCGSCSEVWYCTREHQRLHWEDHFRECKSYKVKSSPEAGQYIVASRGMKPGFLLLEDDPLVVGPLCTSDLVCLGCHAPIYEKNFFKCPNCSWPMCSLDCASSDIHDNEECDILAEDKRLCGVPQSHGETPRYDLILLLRCLLLKNSNPKMWNLILSMASHGRKLKEQQEPYQIAAVRYLTEICKVDVDADTVHHVRGVILTNALEIRGRKGAQLRALYPNIRLLNHSCLPNVHLACTLDGVMKARTAVIIKKEEMLCISYTGTDVPLWERQACLLNNHYFNCSCQRCVDTSELGTMFSSSRCPMCPQQILKPSIHGGCITWTCSKCRTESSIEEITQEIEDWLFRLEMNDLFGSGTPYKISHALAMVEQHFHIKHYLWLKASQAALYKMNYDQSFAAMKLKKYIWEKILELFDILEPGLTRRRGMTLIELANATFNLTSQEFLMEDHISVHQAKNLLLEAKCLYYEGYNILRMEPVGTPEHTMAKAIPLKITLIGEDLERLP